MPGEKREDDWRIYSLVVRNVVGENYPCYTWSVASTSFRWIIAALGGIGRCIQGRGNKTFGQGAPGSGRDGSRERETCETRETIIQDPRRKTIIDLRWRRFAGEKNRTFFFPFFVSLFPFAQIEKEKLYRGRKEKPPVFMAATDRGFSPLRFAQGIWRRVDDACEQTRKYASRIKEVLSFPFPFIESDGQGEIGRR